MNLCHKMLFRFQYDNQKYLINDFRSQHPRHSIHTFFIRKCYGTQKPKNLKKMLRKPPASSA